MLSKNDFISKYSEYSEDELYDVYLDISNYSDEAKEALEIVLLKKGGVEKLLKRQNEKQVVAKEIQRIKSEVLGLKAPGIDTAFLKKIITSDILPQESINEVIDSKHAEVELEQDDKKIKPRTIIGSVIGGSIASVLGGILWGLQMIYSNRIFYILVIGLIILCYGIIKLSTKQSKKNVVVLIATVISVFVALVIGLLLYDIVGYQG